MSDIDERAVRSVAALDGRARLQLACALGARLDALSRAWLEMPPEMEWHRPRTLTQALAEIVTEEEMADQRNSLGRLNEVLFNQLERLDALDVSDEEATKREIERSRAIEGTAKSITENGKTILQATRMRAEFGVGVQFPKMLGE